MLSVTGSPLRDQSGVLVGGVVVFSDVTQRWQHEEEMARKNAELATAYAELDRTRLDQLQLKDQLLSHVSHELRTPLTAATQFVEILRDGLGGPLNDEQLEYAGIAQRNLRQLSTMIGDLLDATRLESARLTIAPERMSIAPIVEELCRSLRSPASEKRIALENRVLEVPEVYADPNRVRQVIANLLHNAIKFTESGAVTVDAVAVPGERPTVQVTVADTGCGMTPDVLSRIFTRLYQAESGGPASRRGVGLGLYICRELVTRQGGAIWAESEPGVGSRFHCTFPLFDAAVHGERSAIDAQDDPGDRG
jgi:signal transduction histidine kinase